MQIKAIYYDGRQARAHAVMLWVEDGRLRLQGGEVDRNEALSALNIQPPLAGTPRLILFADGGRCEIADHRGFAQLLPQHAASTVAGMENSWRYALAALLLCVGLLVAAFLLVVPYVAEVVAERIPATLLTRMDQQFFANLDQKLLQPSTLSEQRRQSIERGLQRLILPPGAIRPERIEFRSCPQLGANAFALPGGTVIVLDELVGLATNDDEVVAVLAHEMGHIAEKHALRHMLQASVVGLAMSWYLGDISSLLAAAPTVLLEARYSRDFERSADQFAADLLRANAIPPARLADMLQKLEVAHWSKQAGQSAEAVGAIDYLSTHPNTDDRINRLRAM